MRISIKNSNRYVIEFDQFIVNGRVAASGYAFTFTLRGGRQVCEPPLIIFDIRLGFSISDPERPVAPYIPASNQVTSCHNYSSNNEQFHFDLVLTREQINSIEEYRQEGDLKCNISLKALISSSDGLLSSFETSEVIIPREEWLNALRSARFRQTLLFEVPLPPKSDAFMKTLSKAQEFIETGHYKDAVMQCRLIIESIEMTREDKRLSAAANSKAHSDNRKEMSSIERLLSLREQLKNICQLGAHGSEDFTRSQARTILGMTLSIVAEPTVGFRG